jgi:hypothetical protein
MSASNPPASTLASFFRQREAWLVPALCGGALVVAGLSLYALFRVERKASREGGADLLDSDPPGPGSATAPRTGGASASGGVASDLTPHERALEQDFVCREKIDVDFADVGGLEAQIQEIEDLVLLPLSHPHLFAHSRIAQRPTGMLLYGPPGTGKTLLAKAIARRANANFFTVNVANGLWRGGRRHGSGVGGTFDEVRQACLGVRALFLNCAFRVGEERVAVYLTNQSC